MPSRQEAFIKCRALSAKCLHRGIHFILPTYIQKPEVIIYQMRRITRPLSHFYLLGEIGNCRYFTASSFWLKWTRQQLPRSGEKFLKQTCTVKNSHGKLTEAANSPCARSWRNTTLTLQTSHCIKLAAFKTTSGKLHVFHSLVSNASMFYTYANRAQT